REELVKKLAKNNEELSGTVGALFSEETLRATAEALFGFLPGKEVADGTNWTNDATVPLGLLGNLVGKCTYKLVGKEKDNNVVRLSAKTTASYVPPAKPASLPFKIVKGDFKTEKAEGELRFDTAVGRLVQAETVRHLKGTVTV